ncbi:MAG: lytic transglycosylase domain-containing protein, partial [Anaerolineales bacterium]
MPRQLLPEETAEPTGFGCLAIFLWPPFSVAFFGALLFFGLTQISASAATSKTETGDLAEFFTPQVQQWKSEILRWSAENHLDPNLVATVMQIESCGDPLAISPAGAMGLFQVMPYHFAESEKPFAPDTNASRGLNYLRRALDKFEGDASLALAGYNGGIGGAYRPQFMWAQETVDYVYWGANIYADALAGRARSSTLEEWLATGGAS